MVHLLIAVRIQLYDKTELPDFTILSKNAANFFTRKQNIVIRPTVIIIIVLIEVPLATIAKSGEVTREMGRAKNLSNFNDRFFNSNINNGGVWQEFIFDNAAVKS